MTDLCAVVLAAGEGTRLRPLTEQVPKALCPVGNVPLLDLALARLAVLGLTGPGAVAVNACYLADQVVAAVGGRAHLSVEPGPRPLGTSGGLGRLRDWIDGRCVLVTNADAYLAGGDIAPLLDGWDGRTTRLLGTPTEPDEWSWEGRYRFAGCSLLPWSRVAGLAPEPSELVKTVWRPAEAAGELTVTEYLGTYLDTGTPGSYLAANLHAAGELGLLVGPGATVTGDVAGAVIGAGATVEGTVRRCVVWPGGYVGPHEHLADAVRYGRSGTVRAGGSPPESPAACRNGTQPAPEGASE
jgi:NDP-sugar pyrophosphorylase family protein